MANTYKPDSKVAMETRKFQSEFGYSRDISNDDIPAANNYNESTLHNETSLNANPDIQSTADQRSFKVPGVNRTLKPNSVKINPTIDQGNGISKLFGATPSADQQYDQYSKSFE